MSDRLWFQSLRVIAFTYVAIVVLAVGWTVVSDDPLEQFFYTLCAPMFFAVVIMFPIGVYAQINIMESED